MKKLFLSLLIATFVAMSASAKSLVIYFSWGGTTEKMANMIVKSTGSDIWEIEPTQSYPKTYQKCGEIVKEELENNIIRKVNGKAPDFSKYDTIYVGVPVWWHTAPTLVTNFLEEHKSELTGKTVIPFCTYAATYRDETLAKLVEVTPTAEHKEGYGTTNPKQNDVDDWLKKIGEIK